MPQESDIVDRVRVATPCTASWDAMRGNDRVRFCEQCNLNVYNFSALTRAEVTALVTQTEGHLCGRLYRRADGTLLTRDCPTGLRGWYRRAVQRAGATLALLFGLSSGVWAQDKVSTEKQPEKAEECQKLTSKQVKLTRHKAKKNDKKAHASLATLSGTVKDPNGAAVPGAKVTLRNDETNQIARTETDDEGRFSLFVTYPQAAHTLEVTATGFGKNTIQQLKFASDERAEIDISLNMGGLIGEIVVPDNPKRPIEMTPSIKTVITREMIERLPF